jgi:hypothetical protein
MAFIARNLKDSSKAIRYEPLVFRPENRMLKVKVIKGEVDFDAEYELSFTHGGKQYRFLGIPVDAVGDKLLFELREIEEEITKTGSVNLERKPIPAQICTEEGYCVNALCVSFSLDGAELLLPHGGDGIFRKEIEEKHPFTVKFTFDGETFEVKGLPVAYDKTNGKLTILFGLGEENRAVLDIYNRLKRKQTA